MRFVSGEQIMRHFVPNFEPLTHEANMRVIMAQDRTAMRDRIVEMGRQIAANERKEG